MNKDQIAHAWEQMSAKAEIIRSFKAWLENERAISEDAVCLPLASDMTRHFNAGRLSMVKDLKDTIDKQWPDDPS